MIIAISTLSALTSFLSCNCIFTQNNITTSDSIFDSNTIIRYDYEDVHGYNSTSFNNNDTFIYQDMFDSNFSHAGDSVAFTFALSNGFTSQYNIPSSPYSYFARVIGTLDRENADNYFDVEVTTYSIGNNGINLNFNVTFTLSYYDSTQVELYTRSYPINFSMLNGMGNHQYLYSYPISSFWDLNDGVVISASVSINLQDVNYPSSYYQSIGYDEGQTHGYNVGKEVGFNLGKSSGQSFAQLIGTIIDAPILYLRKLFGYELFGINLFGALTTLISVVVALAVWRLIKSMVI